MVGVAGALGSLNDCVKVFDGQPEPLSKVMLYVPAANEGIVAGSVTAVNEPEAVPVQLSVPVPVPVT